MRNRPATGRRCRALRPAIVVGLLVAVVLGSSVAPVPAPDRSVVAAPGQPDVVILGDSLTGGNASYIGPTLSAAGLDVRVEGLSARRITVSYNFLGYRDSGIARIRALTAAGVAPALWVIQLGTNDLGAVQNCRCPDPVAFAGALVDQLLAEIGPSVPIAWVTVVDRKRPGAAESFNAAISFRAARDPFVALIRWHSLAGSHPEWFLDSVHPNALGVRIFTQMYIDAIRTLLADPLGPPIPGPGLATATRLGPT